MRWELKRRYVEEIELKRKLGSNGKYWLSFLFSQRKVGVSRMILFMSSKGHSSLNEVDNWFYSCYYGHCFRRKTKLIFLHANCFIKRLHCKNSIKPWRTCIVLSSLGTSLWSRRCGSVCATILDSSTLILWPFQSTRCYLSAPN